jgi:outer membrane protein assembly factor BamA
VGYSYQQVNDPIVPTRGLLFYGAAAYTTSLSADDQGFATYNGILQAYYPVYRRLSLAVRIGLTAVDGKPEFYQYASTGGSYSLRGYRRDRWRGRTAFYSSQELRYIAPFRSYWLNADVGLIGFVDVGRVWLPGELSHTLHASFGGGVLIAPFHIAQVSVTYGVSPEAGLFHIRLSRTLRQTQL